MGRPSVFTIPTYAAHEHICLTFNRLNSQIDSSLFRATDDQPPLPPFLSLLHLSLRSSFACRPPCVCVCVCVILLLLYARLESHPDVRAVFPTASCIEAAAQHSGGEWASPVPATGRLFEDVRWWMYIVYMPCMGLMVWRRLEWSPRVRPHDPRGHTTHGASDQSTYVFQAENSHILSSQRRASAPAACTASSIVHRTLTDPPPPNSSGGSGGRGVWRRWGRGAGDGSRLAGRGEVPGSFGRGVTSCQGEREHVPAGGGRLGRCRRDRGDVA